MNEPAKNPYELVWYRYGWSESRIGRNNAKFWAWEIINNGFVPPNSPPDIKEKFIAAYPEMLKSSANR